MKRNHLKLILIAACLMLFTGALAACRQNIKDLDDLTRDGYTCEVVFDLNGGTSGNGDRARTELRQYAKSNSLIIKPGTGQFSGEEPVRDGYTLGGYYRGTREEDGTITYGEKWDFTQDKVTGSLRLYAYWLKNYELVIHYGEGFGETQTVHVEQSEDGTPLELQRPVIQGYTAINFYDSQAKAEAKNEADALKFPYTDVADKFTEQSPTWEIWADALEGNFVLVRTAADFKLVSNTNIYLMASIDFEGATLELPEVYQGKFYGNGHTLSNFTVKRESQDKPVDKYIGFFGTITGTAVISNVTFDQVTLNIEAGNPLVSHHYVGGFAGKANNGAILEHVTFNCTMTYNIAGQQDGEPEIAEFICDRGENVTVTDCTYNVTLINAKPAN